MPRPIWKGSISFGLVNIPIGLFTAEGKEKKLDLHLLDKEDLLRANPKATQTVEITDFVEAKDIHPIFFQKPYFLAPAGRGEKGYALLGGGPKKTGAAGG